MSSIKQLYRKNIYGVMGTLIFHILVVAIFWLAELNKNVKIEKEEAVLIDFHVLEKMEETPKPETDKQQEKNTAADQAMKNSQELAVIVRLMMLQIK